MAAPVDLTGQRFGKLVASHLFESGGKRRKWYCVCDCGGDATVITENLRSGNSKACGQCRISTLPNRRHGHTGDGWASPTYISWRAMLARCTNPKRANAKHYLERGISYDPRWSHFENFLADMGERPGGLTLDRRDNDVGYSKANCRWATPLEQRHNRRDACRVSL
jgi:hypothetical protein